MEGFAERLGDGVIEPVIPAAWRLEDHTELIGQCLMLALALAMIWSSSGIVRRR